MFLRDLIRDKRLITATSPPIAWRKGWAGTTSLKAQRQNGFRRLHDSVDFLLPSGLGNCFAQPRGFARWLIQIWRGGSRQSSRKMQSQSYTTRRRLFCGNEGSTAGLDRLHICGIFLKNFTSTGATSRASPRTRRVTPLSGLGVFSVLSVS